ncbi:MAG: hypothetical protein HY938_04370 [Nitrosomonadales bacterium]|nr:hypothetical protein [Nitrosomonadales bacterium]
MGPLKELKLKFREAKRIGAFSRARKQGMSVEQARAYSDHLYPPTAEDIEYENQLRQGKTDASVFPWISALSLLYPVAAMVYIATRTPAPPRMVVGYGLGNLAYLLLVAGIFTGKFGVFGLRSRWQVG